MAHPSRSDGWGVVPENVIQAETDTLSRELAGYSSPAMANVRVTLAALAYRSLDLEWWRVAQARMADTNEQSREFKPRGNSNDAVRRLAELR